VKIIEAAFQGICDLLGGIFVVEIKAYESFGTVDERVFTVLSATDPDALGNLFSYGTTIWWNVLLHIAVLVIFSLLYTIVMNRRVEFGE